MHVLYNVTCVIVLQRKCQLKILKWRRVKTSIMLYTFYVFDMALLKNVKSRVFLDFEKRKKTYSRTMLHSALYYWIRRVDVL